MKKTDPFGSVFSCLVFVFDPAVHILPKKGAVLKGHVAVVALLLGDGGGAGVQIHVLLTEALAGGHMGVAVEEDVTALQRQAASFCDAVVSSDDLAAAADALCAMLG